MKQVNTKTVKRIQKYAYKWLEGLDREYVVTIKNIWKLKPKYYWKEADSFIIHKHNSLRYYCISRSYWKNLL